VQRNIEAHLHKNCCHGKINITFSECVVLALVNQLESCMACLILHSFLHCLKNVMVYGERLVNVQSVF
jgi:hypothetical protein